ncbi:hypothetical protein JKF63_02764 [Porcisia hertigi]|uniref:Surface antigen-like protein n=1 Tax=Porcisia hertigi TaxID=2761500 RepID=A0A836IN44_9TRYP|nr:hypothetical protein JKF63_02764 [Porcisia hertigi]
MASQIMIAVACLLAIAMMASAQICPPGTSSVNGQCRFNCQVANCDICDPSDLTHSTCATCSLGFRPGGSGTCEPMCTVLNCVLCSSSGNNACQTCQTGYLRTAAGMCRRGSGISNSATTTTTTAASVALACTIMAALFFTIAA